MAFKINLSEIEKPQPAPEGTYVAHIVNSETGESSKGNPMLKLRWKLIDEEEDGKMVFHNLVYTPQTAWVFENLFKALGEDTDADEDIDVETYEFEGEVAMITIEVAESHKTAGDFFNSVKTVAELDESDKAMAQEYVLNMETE